jgi:hypothetical protein
MSVVEIIQALQSSAGDQGRLRQLLVSFRQEMAICQDLKEQRRAVRFLLRELAFIDVDGDARMCSMGEASQAALACDPLIVWQEAIDVLQVLSAETSSTKALDKSLSPDALETTLKVLLRLLFSESSIQDDTPFVLRVIHQGASDNAQSQPEAVSIWVRSVLRLDRLVANACQRQKQGLPLVWYDASVSSSSLRSTTVSNRLLRQALEHYCSASTTTAAQIGPDNPDHRKEYFSSHETVVKDYTICLFVGLIRQRGATHMVAQVLQSIMSAQTVSTANLTTQLLSLLSHVAHQNLSPRETAVLWKAYDQCVRANGATNGARWSVARALLGHSVLIHEATVDHLLFSAVSPSTEEDIRALIHALSSLQSSDIEAEELIDGNEDDDDDGAERSNHSSLVPQKWSIGQRALARQVSQVSRKWSSFAYIRQTDSRVQVGPSRFLEWAISYLNGLDMASDIVLNIVDGVTPRLESEQLLVRHHGMRVAEALARVLGQKLSFDELRQEEKTARDGASLGESMNKGFCLSGSGNLDTREVAPAAHHKLDDPTLVITGRNETSGVPWDDSDEHFQPYGLDDDEEDLRPTPRPAYVRDVLDLLRTPESEEFARSHHETALQELPALVRAGPMDLVDVAPSLAVQVLRMENKFNLDSFENMVVTSLVALIVSQPASVVESLIREFFLDGGLSDRLMVLGSLTESAIELSGYKDQKEKRDSLSATLRIIKDRPKTSGRKALVAQSAGDKLATKTTRWRRKVDAVSIQNNFARVAPLWFYGLLGNFIKRREDPVLWGGAVGSTLLSKLLLTLAMIVELSGRGPSTEMMAKDLFECAWGFRQAEVSEIRSACLYSVTAAVANMQEGQLMVILSDEGVDGFSASLKRIVMEDPDYECRNAAGSIARNVKAAIEAMGPLMLPSHSSGTRGA